MEGRKRRCARGEIIAGQQTDLIELPLCRAEKSVDDASLARGQRVGRAVLSVNPRDFAPVEGVLRSSRRVNVEAQFRVRPERGKVVGVKELPVRASQILISLSTYTRVCSSGGVVAVKLGAVDDDARDGARGHPRPDAEPNGISPW